MKISTTAFEYSPYAVLFKSINQWNYENPKLKIDPLEEQILYRVLVAEYDGEYLCISDLLGSEDIGSQSTINGRVKKLIQLGYLNLVICDTDNRKKIIEPTQAAINFDQQRSNFLLMAANKNT